MTTSPIFSRKFIRNGTAIVILFAALKLIIHLATNSQYGFNRDELYYLACSEHLDFGYVDHPPFTPILAFIVRHTLGGSLFMLRLLPAIAGALMVLLVGIMVRRLGGGITAQIIAALCVIVAPIFLSMGILFTTNVFDQLFWTVCFYLLILMLKGNNLRYWLTIGTILGVGLLNKYSMLFLAIGLLIGFLLTSSRKMLFTKQFIYAVAIAIVIFIPNIIWQINHDWPTLEFLKKSVINRMPNVSPFEFIRSQFFAFNPVVFPVSIIGLAYLLFSKKAQRFRALAWIFVTVFVILAFQRSKDYYLAPAYPVIWAFGAIALERFASGRPRKWLARVTIAALIISGAVMAPLALPILPIEQADSYGRRFGDGLHPVFSDMLGWENMVKTVAGVYNELPAEERANCAVMANNYGQAAAIDFFGGKYGLPKSISTHNSYWLWGPRNYTGDFVITAGVKKESLGQGFSEVKLGATIVNDHVVWYENNQPVYIWSGPKIPLKKIWPRIKLYY